MKKDSLPEGIPDPLASADAALADDPLSSWNDGATKQSIISFVEKVTTEGSPSFVPVPERIATFDNDGTLWCEQPVPVQVYFALDRVKALVSQHPEWKTQEPFASLLEEDLRATLAAGDEVLLEIVMATHAGMTTVEFGADHRGFDSHREAFRRPGRLFHRKWTYAPMLELLAYLRANGFRNLHRHGRRHRVRAPMGRTRPRRHTRAGHWQRHQDEIRAARRKAGSHAPAALELQQRQGRQAGHHHQHIGRAPLAAFGNSVGDQQMLEYTHGGSGVRFGLLVLHDDAAREYAYGPALGLPTPQLGAFTPALYEQAKRASSTMSMKDDWKQVFPFEASAVTAINILLEPDATMLQRSEANNARLLEVFPKGFALDATRRPHVTLLQRFVRTANLDKIYAATGKVFVGSHVLGLRLEAFSYYYNPSGAIGLAGIVARPSPELRELQRDLIDAVAPFTVATGGSDAFATTPDDPVIDPLLIDYVSTFVPKSTGEHFSPHVTTGIAPRDYLDQMLAEPFESFTFSPAGAAVYQLGQFGTAAEETPRLGRKALRRRRRGSQVPPAKPVACLVSPSKGPAAPRR